MKHEWKKTEKKLYLPKGEPQRIVVPAQKFFAIKGKGDPNQPDFSERVGALYALAYTLKMLPKTGFMPEGYFDYAVYPLEGVWDGGSVRDKSSYSYTIMIRQPDFATAELAAAVIEAALKKKQLPLIKEAFFCETEDGLSVHMLHTGSYDDEPASFAKMDSFCESNGLIRSSLSHREIYLSDPNKTAKDKMKTVLRYTVRSR